MHIQPHMSSVMPWARRSLTFLAACALSPLFATFAHADAVTDWNETAIRAAASVGRATGRRTSRGAPARAAARPARMSDGSERCTGETICSSSTVLNPVGAKK